MRVCVRAALVADQRGRVPGGAGQRRQAAVGDARPAVRVRRRLAAPLRARHARGGQPQARGYRTLDASICGYNHLTWEQYNATTGKFKAVYDRKTRLLYKKFCNTIFLNQYGLEEIEGELARQADKEHVVFADHEQYFYRDYLAYQPDYAEKIFKAAGYLRRRGYEFVFIEDTV